MKVMFIGKKWFDDERLSCLYLTSLQWWVKGFTLGKLTLKLYSKLTRKGKLMAWRIRFSFNVCSTCFNFTTYKLVTKQYGKQERNRNETGLVNKNINEKIRSRMIWVILKGFCILLISFMFIFLTTKHKTNITSLKFSTLRWYFILTTRGKSKQ